MKKTPKTLFYLAAVTMLAVVFFAQDKNAMKTPTDAQIKQSELRDQIIKAKKELDDIDIFVPGHELNTQDVTTRQNKINDLVKEEHYYLREIAREGAEPLNRKRFVPGPDLPWDREKMLNLSIDPAVEKRLKPQEAKEEEVESKTEATTEPEATEPKESEIDQTTEDWGSI